ncbi:hypothetical protein lerEdw1_006874 [Lerista edwardsae]|nr:hypothetical protein lerEdw1_006874 [Lerista edwardsae]
METSSVVANVPENSLKSSLQEPSDVSLGDVSVTTPFSVQVHHTKTAEETKETAEMLKSKGAVPAVGLYTTKRDGEVKLRMDESGIGSDPPITVHELFLNAVNEYGNYSALASKKHGKWTRITFKKYYELCRMAAKSFIKLGLERFHGVCILGFNSLEWFVADVGAIFAGGLAAGIYTTNSPEACHYIAANCSANIIVVENDKQLQKILEVQDKLPSLKAIIQYSGELREKKPNLYSWNEFMALGRTVTEEELNKIINSQKPNQCCTLIYTSGTTGQPKGVMLSHDNGTLVETLKEVRPTAFMGVPRVWEKMEEKMKSVGAKSSALKKKIAMWAKVVGLETNLKRMHGSTDLPMNFRLARTLVYKKVRKALGLDRCTKCYTGAAPITKETLEYFLSLDIPVYELYGMSESTGPHTVSHADSFRLTSCGKEITGVRTMIFKPDSDGIGEVCFAGRHVFMGYLNMDDKTKEAVDSDGWLHSGDLGKHDADGFLYVTGRIKELIITAGGENIPPVPIEDAVKEAVPILSNVMLVGDKAKFLGMLMTLKATLRILRLLQCKVNLETGEPEDSLTPDAIEFCQKLGSKSTRVSDIVGGKDPAVYAAIQKGITLVNDRAISNAQKIQKWLLLDKDFSIAGGELGPTMKLKRPVVAAMYKREIDTIYMETK